MKRLEVVISDETDAMLDEMLASGEGSKAAFAGRLIEEGVQAALRHESVRVNGTSKPWLCLEEAKAVLAKAEREGLSGHKPIPPDPLDALMGSVDADPRVRQGGDEHDPLDDLLGRYDEEPGDIDEIIYGR